MHATGEKFVDVRACQHTNTEDTLIKKKTKFSLFTRIQNGAVANLYMTNDLLIQYMVKYLRISSYIRKPFLIYDFATAQFWISLYNEENLIIFFSQCIEYKIFVGLCWKLSGKSAGWREMSQQHPLSHKLLLSPSFLYLGFFLLLSSSCLNTIAPLPLLMLLIQLLSSSTLFPYSSFLFCFYIYVFLAFILFVWFEHYSPLLLSLCFLFRYYLAALSFPTPPFFLPFYIYNSCIYSLRLVWTLQHPLPLLMLLIRRIYSVLILQHSLSWLLHSSFLFIFIILAFILFVLFEHYSPLFHSFCFLFRSYLAALSFPTLLSSFIFILRFLAFILFVWFEHYSPLFLSFMLLIPF